MTNLISLRLPNSSEAAQAIRTQQGVIQKDVAHGSQVNPELLFDMGIAVWRG